MGEALTPSLTPPAEPVELRVRLRESAGHSPDDTRRLLESGEGVGDYLWGAWATELTDGSVSRDDIVGYAGTSWRELWLWVMGERTWDEAAALVGGGVIRRAARP